MVTGFLRKQRLNDDYDCCFQTIPNVVILFTGNWQHFCFSIFRREHARSATVPSPWCWSASSFSSSHATWGRYSSQSTRWRSTSGKVFLGSFCPKNNAYSMEKNNARPKRIYVHLGKASSLNWLFALSYKCVWNLNCPTFAGTAAGASSPFGPRTWSWWTTSWSCSTPASTSPSTARTSCSGRPSGRSTGPSSRRRALRLPSPEGEGEEGSRGGQETWVKKIAYFVFVLAVVAAVHR